MVIGNQILVQGGVAYFLILRGSSCHELSAKPKYVALGGLDHQEHPDPGSAVGVLLVRSGAPRRSITRP